METRSAAIRATFSNVRLIQGRKVFQLIFEVPLEAADQTLKDMGGMPDPSKEQWFAIARLNGEQT